MLNIFTVHGRITKDPDFKVLRNDKSAVSFSIACDRDFKNKSGEKETDFFNCVAYGGTADFIQKYFSKGQEILINGRVQIRSWKDDNNTTHTVTEVVVNAAEFCGSKAKSDSGEKKSSYAFPYDGKSLEDVTVDDADLPF